MMAEFFGSIILSIAFAGLAIVMPNGKKIIVYMDHQIFVAIYGFFVILLVLILFLR
jgi:uncharacterized membrane protein